MNTKFQKPLWRFVLIIVLASLIVSCQPTTPPTQNVYSNEIQDIRVQVTEPTKATSKVEQFPLPNCGGSDKLAQSLGTFASVSKSATVGGKATVTGGGEVAIPETAKLKLEIQVELAYQQTFESANSRLDTIVMSAAAGTHVVYTIVWDEQTFNSIVQYSSDGKVYEVPYTYNLSVPKIDKSYNVACDGNNTGSSDSENITVTQTPLTSSSDKCMPPAGLIPLWVDVPVTWSNGIWGSSNMSKFMSAIGEVDSNNPDFGPFQIWVDPCSFEWHGYVDGARFWPHTSNIGKSFPVQIGGTTAITIDIPKNTGAWGLGNPSR